MISGKPERSSNNVAAITWREQEVQAPPQAEHLPSAARCHVIPCFEPLMPSGQVRLSARRKRYAMRQALIYTRAADLAQWLCAGGGSCVNSFISYYYH